VTALAIRSLPLNQQPAAHEPSDPARDVQLAAKGDRRAFERLYRANTDRVYSLCVRMVGDRGRAEELTQDVFVRAWQKLDSFRGDSAFSTWLHRLAVNLVLNDRKAAKRQDGRLDHGIEDIDSLPATRTREDNSPGLSMDLEKAIAKLPPGARKVFVLHDVQGYTHEEIAGFLGVTSGGCKAQLHRARMLLREALNR
jgi:RNA polymerase sigma-70 factor (ECF subfamily)